MQILNHIFIMKHVHFSNGDVLLELRLDLLHFQLAIESRDFDYSVSLLDRIQERFIDVTNDIEIIRLPNQMYCPFIDLWVIDNEKMLVKCMQLQSDLYDYFSNEQFDIVVGILLKYRQRDFECSQFTAFDQMEMVLQSLWMLNRFDDCLRWCEMGLHDSVVKWRKGNAKTTVQRFAQHTRFLMVYLRELLHKGYACKCPFSFFCFICHFFFHFLTWVLLCSARISKTVVNLLNAQKEQLIRSLTHLFEAQYDGSLSKQRIMLFNSNDFVGVLNAILECGCDADGAESQLIILNIIAKVAEWIIRNNVPMVDDGAFLMCVWNNLNCNGIDLTALKFNRSEIIRLLAHAIFGYPHHIDEHQTVCTCTPTTIEWNGIPLFLTFIDTISNRLVFFHFARILESVDSVRFIIMHASDNDFSSWFFE